MVGNGQQSTRITRDIAPDCLVGGTLIEQIQEIPDGTPVKFFSYVGRIVDHPCLLRGTVGEVSDQARAAEQAGVDGINLLAYRHDGDVPEPARRAICSSAASACASAPGSRWPYRSCTTTTDE